MKKSIYISGIVSANLLMFGCMFKVQHWPGAGVLLILSILLFCFHFLPVALFNSYKSQEQKKFKWLHIITFVVFFIGMMGVLFKVMHWPGASIFLFIGIPLPFVLFLPVYLYQTRNEKKNGTVNFTGIMFGLTFLAVFSVLLALNVSRDVMDRLATNINKNDIATFLSQSSPKNWEENNVKQNSDELCAFINDLKCELLSETENDLCENNKLKLDYDAKQIFNQENSNIPFRILYGEGQNNKMNELKAKINTYRESILASEKMNPELMELANALFDTNPQESENEEGQHNLSWEQRKFSSYQLIVVMDVLSEIQSNARLVESEILAIK